MRARTACGDEAQAAVPGPGRNLLRGALLIVAALLSSCACYAVFAWWLPDERGLYRDYRAAVECSERTATGTGEECLREVTFTVEGTDTRVRHLRATLRGPAPYGTTTVPFGDPGPVLEALGEGDQVTATLWRGTVVEVAYAGSRQDSSDAPRDEPQPIAAAGTLAALLAVQALVFSVVLLLRPRDPGLFVWRPFGKTLLLVSVVGCVGVGLLSVWTGLPWQVGPAVCGPVTVATAYLLHRDLRLRNGG
ncbi:MULTISPECIES: hypothetical protein [unclassified Streptomyces]|uniref:hypothetical protein n=1 Tax=unclassified Streptomyces TaxID=2593676 RepID=UPI000DBA9221|nr:MULTISPECIES: hypothetical protein [unclassified Streptomyces]MYT73400.1 hypothetical protein [Streptomyces sp. SID8367]